MKFFLPLVLISVVLNAAPIYLKCEIVDKTTLIKTNGKKNFI